MSSQIKLLQNATPPSVAATYTQIYTLTDNTVHALLADGTDVLLYSPSVPPTTAFIALASAYG